MSTIVSRCSCIGDPYSYWYYHSYRCFKFDQTPVDGQVTEFNKFAEFGDQGVLALMADSTNAERPGYTQSEK